MMMAERHHEMQELADEPTRMTMGEWHQLVEKATASVFRKSAMWGEQYRAADIVLRDALPDRCPVDGRNG